MAVIYKKWFIKLMLYLGIITVAILAFRNIYLECIKGLF